MKPFCGLTSFSFRMLHCRGVTDAGLDGGSFCLISRAAASSLPAFLLEITTLQPEDQKRKPQLVMIRLLVTAHHKMHFLHGKDRQLLNIVNF